MRVESARDGHVWAQEYERGKPHGPRQEDRPAGRRAAARRPASGPTPRCSRPPSYSFETISQRLRESAYLTKGVWITLIDERSDRERSFYFEGGLQSFVRHLNRNKEALHTDRSTSSARRARPRSRSPSSTTTRYTENVLAFANNINTLDGGTPRDRLPRRPDALAQRLGAPGRRPQGQRQQPLRRRRPRGPDGGHQRQAAPTRSSRARPRPSSATPRSRARSRPRSPTASASTSTRTRPTAGGSSRSA